MPLCIIDLIIVRSDIMASKLALRSSQPFLRPSFTRPAQRLTKVQSPFRPLQAQRHFATPAIGAAEQPHLRLGSIAPNFQAKTTQGDIDFHQWLEGKWAILFSHPADFTPVCTTELGAFAKMKGEFEKRGVKMIGLVSYSPS